VSTGQLTAGQLDELIETVMAKTGAKGNGFKVVNGELVYRAAAPKRRSSKGPTFCTQARSAGPATPATNCRTA
jgi:hypothetical protein